MRARTRARRRARALGERFFSGSFLRSDIFRAVVSRLGVKKGSASRRSSLARQPRSPGEAPGQTRFRSGFGETLQPETLVARIEDPDPPQRRGVWPLQGPAGQRKPPLASRPAVGWVRGGWEGLDGAREGPHQRRGEGPPPRREGQGSRSQGEASAAQQARAAGPCSWRGTGVGEGGAGAGSGRSAQPGRCAGGSFTSAGTCAATTCSSARLTPWRRRARFERTAERARRERSAPRSALGARSGTLTRAARGNPRLLATHPGAYPTGMQTGS